MPRYVCLLRGINVGGHRIIKMADLKASLEALKFSDVLTYIQSGNVIFSTRQNKPESIAKKVKKKIQDDFGFDVPVYICTESHFHDVAREHPFEAAAKERKHICVTFLHKSPDGDAILSLAEATEGFDDEYFLVGTEVYLHCPNGYLKTKISNEFLEKKLSVSATTRNWNSVQKISTLLQK